MIKRVNKKGENYVPKNILIGIILIIVLLVFVLLIYYYAGKEEKVSEIADSRSVMTSAVAEKNGELCDEIKDETGRMTCKLNAAVAIKDADYCESGFKNEKLKFSLTIAGDKLEREEYSAVDECFRVLAFFYGKDYCENIKNEVIKERCIGK